MAVKAAEHAQATYDRVAGSYDDLWSRHVAEPNAKLTRQLKLKSGERLADLACGTGVFTIDMGRMVAPGEVIGVDYSEGMLRAAKDRAVDAGLSLTLVHAKAEDFIEQAAPTSLDVLSFRFALAYVDWRNVLPRIGRIMRPGGRVGLLTSLSGSIPQGRALYEQIVSSFGGETNFPSPVPDETAEAADALASGGLEIEDAWDFRVRLWFDDGVQAATWLRESGYATHPSLGEVDPAALESLQQIFAAGLEQFREAPGVPLDLVIGGVIARRS